MKKQCIILCFCILIVLLIPSFAMAAQKYEVWVTTNCWTAYTSGNTTLYVPYLKIDVKNVSQSALSKIEVKIVFYDESQKSVWSEETYYLLSQSDVALKSGYSKTAYIRSSVGYKSKISEFSLPNLTAEIYINNYVVGEISINKTYDEIVIHELVSQPAPTSSPTPAITVSPTPRNTSTPSPDDLAGEDPAPDATDNTVLDASTALDFFPDKSIDELLILNEQVNQSLKAKGYVVYFDIERNDKGEHVSRLQERLKDLGYYSGRITGKLDSETMKAEKQFEKANGLTNDGLPSREDQMILFSVTAIGNNMSADPTANVIKTPDANEEFYADYGDFDYEDAFRYPEKHYFEKVVIKGNVVQVLGSRKDGFQLRLSLLGSDDIVYVFVNNDPGYNILEGDKLYVYGQLMGTITYESIYGQSITIPACNANYLVLK